MPNCPKCRARMALCEDGAICPKCLREYTPEQLTAMPGYDENLMLQHIALYITLIQAGLIGSGLNEIIINEVGVTINHKGEVS